MLIKYTSFAKLATLQATRMFPACPAKVTNPAPPPPPPPPFSSAYRSNLACGYLHLQRRPPHLIFCSTSFQRPPAPVANASTSLPLLAAQADQALQPFPRILQTMWPAAEASAKLPPPATCQRSKFSATKVSPTYRIRPPPFKAPALRRTAQPSPRLQYGAACLPVPPRLMPPSAAARLHPRLQGSNHLLQPPPTCQSSRTLHQQKTGPWQDYVKFSPALASSSHDVQASQISSPSTTLSSPGNFKIPPLHSNQRQQRARAANHPTRGPAQSSLPQEPASGHRTAAAGPRPAWAASPDAAATSPNLPRASAERQLATQHSEEPAFASTSRLARTSTPPSAAYSYTQPRINEPLPYPWPAAPPLTASPTPSAQDPAPVFPPPFPLLSPFTKPFQAQTYPNH